MEIVICRKLSTVKHGKWTLSPTNRRPQPKVVPSAILILVPVPVIGILTDRQKISYFFLPLWDKPSTPLIHLPHCYAENVSMEHLCHLHGWSIRLQPRCIFDSHELDLLDIRLGVLRRRESMVHFLAQLHPLAHMKAHLFLNHGNTELRKDYFAVQGYPMV